MTTPETVLAFLQSNPDFLTKHPELLPMQQGNVVNFQQVMVQKLRTDKERSENRQRTMVENARANMTVQARMHAAVLRVIESETWEELVDTLSNDVALMLQVDVINIAFEQSPNTMLNLPEPLQQLEVGTIARVMGEQNSLLQANIKGSPYLFGPAARLVKSQALLRLNISQDFPDGLIAFGSRDPLLFADSQGTELVGFLVDVVERIIRRI